MAELADAQDSDSCPNIGGAGSSPVIRIKKPLIFQGFFISYLNICKMVYYNKKGSSPPFIRYLFVLYQ